MHFKTTKEENSLYPPTGQANSSTSAAQRTGRKLLNWQWFSWTSSSSFALSFLLRQSLCLLCLIMLYGQSIDLITKEKGISLCKSFPEHFWIGNPTANHTSVQKSHCHYHTFLKKKKPLQISRILSSLCPFKVSGGNKCLSSIIPPHRNTPKEQLLL